MSVINAETAGISSCCISFMDGTENFDACCGMAEMMSKAGCDFGTSPDQEEGEPDEIP